MKKNTSWTAARLFEEVKLLTGNYYKSMYGKLIYCNTVWGILSTYRVFMTNQPTDNRQFIYYSLATLTTIFNIY